VIESLVADLHLPNASYQTSVIAYLHPGRAAQLLFSEKAVGSFGQLHPTVASQYGLGSRTVLVAELDLENVLAKVPERHKFTPVPRFPSALRDIAIVVEEAISAEQVMRELRAAGGELLSDIRLFDVYRGESIPSGTKSLAFALSYQASDRTLTDKEVDKAHKKIEERVKHMLKAQVRGED
jgi:phenylalanyl-tRNA synthetase beta chain